MKSFGGLKIKEIGLSYLDSDILIWVFWRSLFGDNPSLSNQLRTPSVRWLLCFDFESSPFQRDVKDCWTGIGRGPIFFRRFSDVFGFSHQLGWSRVSPSPSTDGLLMVPWKVDSGRIWLVRLESAGGTDKSLITLEMLFTLGYLSWVLNHLMGTVFSTGWADGCRCPKRYDCYALTGQYRAWRTFSVFICFYDILSPFCFLVISRFWLAIGYIPKNVFRLYQGLTSLSVHGKPVIEPLKAWYLWQKYTYFVIVWRAYNTL